MPDARYLNVKMEEPRARQTLQHQAGFAGRACDGLPSDPGHASCALSCMYSGHGTAQAHGTQHLLCTRILLCNKRVREREREEAEASTARALGSMALQTTWLLLRAMYGVRMAAILPDPCRKTAPTFPSGLETRQWCLSRNINQGHADPMSSPAPPWQGAPSSGAGRASSIQIIVPIDRNHAESPGPYIDPDPGGNP